MNKKTEILLTEYELATDIFSRIYNICNINYANIFQKASI